MSRGRLRVYLGAAPGVGKTFAMLDEGHRRIARGTDVVVAVVETHGRPRTAEQADGFEVIPRKAVSHRGASFLEMDIDAVLARAPEVALVDELAHTNVPGSGEHTKRWQDVEQLLEAGIDVISTVNVQHLESLNDVVERVTGVPQRETIPDAVVRAADQIELVDMTPEALRRRMAHGNVYARDKVDAALGNYFRIGNLTALRELALLWMADAVEEGLRRYREAEGIDTTWETKERVVVALTGGPEGETLLRRAARIADRSTGGEMLAVHVARSDGLTSSGVAGLAQQRALVESLSGSYHSVVGDDVAKALLDFARANNATQIVLGVSRRPRWLATITGPGTGATVARDSGSIDVHMVSHDYVGRGRLLPALGGGLTTRRRVTGFAVAALLLPLTTLLLTFVRPDLTLPSDILLHLLAVVVVALVGGLAPALVAAVVASLLLNYYFVPPLHQLTIDQGENVLALVVFIVVAAAVSSVVDLAARRTRLAARAGAEAETVAALAGSVLRGEDALPALLERVQETFGATSVSLLRRDTTAPASRGDAMRGSWTVLAGMGDDVCLAPEQADTEVAVNDDIVLALRGRTLAASDQRLLAAFAAQVGVAYEQRRLSRAAESAGVVAEADRLRTALLAAVSHDLRTPLAGVKAAITSLRSQDVTWTAEETDELVATADESVDRLTRMVGDLLDMSRLQAGVVSVHRIPVGLDEVVSLALDSVDPGQQVLTDVPADLPDVLADPALLERVVANLVQNALRHGPTDSPPLVAASVLRGWVELRVVDEGPGIPEDAREQVFAPFQRLGDRTSGDGAGVGLGLAIARGFIESMGGTLLPEDTPGGGLTMVVSLPTAASVAADAAAVSARDAAVLPGSPSGPGAPPTLAVSSPA